MYTSLCRYLPKKLKLNIIIIGNNNIMTIVFDIMNILIGVFNYIVIYNYIYSLRKNENNISVEYVSRIKSV